MSPDSDRNAVAGPNPTLISEFENGPDEARLRLGGGAGAMSEPVRIFELDGLSHSNKASTMSR